MDIQAGINYMVEHDGLVLPFGLMPGSYPGGIIREFEQWFWDIYEWNPPGAMGAFQPRDENASEKPTWQAILAACEKAKLQNRRLELCRHLRSQAGRRISSAYDAENYIEEIFLRLRDDHTDAQDTERERLRAKYRELKAWINHEDRTQSELDAYDVTDDSLWAEADDG